MDVYNFRKLSEKLIIYDISSNKKRLKISKLLLETRDISNGLLAKHTGKDLKEINQITMTDKYMGAEEAVRFGICDKIVDRICI